MSNDVPLDGNFRTSDLYFAAFLKVAGVPYLDCENEGTRCIFVFENGDGIRDLKRTFFGRAPVKIAALTYADEIQALKSLTHIRMGSTHGLGS